MSQVNVLLTSIVKYPFYLNKNQFFLIGQFINYRLLILKKYLKHTSDRSEILNLQ